MSRRPRVLVLNPTCLEVAEQYRAHAEARFGVELDAHPAYAALDEAGAAERLSRAQAVILPAAPHGFPPEAVMWACPGLLACSVAASGYEWLDVPAATRGGIVVAHAPGGVGAEVVADLTSSRPPSRSPPASSGPAGGSAARRSRWS